MASITLTIMASLVLLLLLSSRLPASHSSINGFSLELIPSFSPKSPLLKFKNQASHASIVESLAPPINASFIVTPPIQQYEIAFVVQVGIGTFDAKSPSASHYKSYYLILDTGSSLTWTQCEDCNLPGNSCYMQMEPVFPNKKSKTYDPLPCRKHRLCERNKCIGDHCSYFVEYADGANSSGILAKETFSFPSTSTSRKEAIADVVFGCGIKSFDSRGSDKYEITGVFGLGWGGRSFVKQIQKQSDGKFSYCLTNTMQTHQRMYLRFGADIKWPRNLRRTDLLRNGGNEAYYVRLRDLGVNGEELGINPGEFRIARDGSGGSVVDSGSSYSFVTEKAYEALEKKMEEYFSGLHEFERYGGLEGKLCYLRRQVKGFNKIPGMNWYFEEGARMDVSAEGTFWRQEQGGEELFCMMIEADKIMHMTTLGAYQQVNHMFIYDTLSSRLHFVPHDCARDG